MGKRSQQKGAEFERALVRLLKGHGFSACRNSVFDGPAGYNKQEDGDVSWHLLGFDRKVECKWRKNGFKQLYKWLEKNDFLAVTANYKDTLIIARAQDFLPIAELAQKAMREAAE